MKKIYLVFLVFLSIILLNSCDYVVLCESYDSLDKITFSCAASKAKLGDKGDGSSYFSIKNKGQFMSANGIYEDVSYIENNGYWYEIKCYSNVVTVSSMCAYTLEGRPFSFPKYLRNLENNTVVLYSDMDKKIESFEKMKDFYRRSSKAIIDEEKITINEAYDLDDIFTIALTPTIDGVRINFNE